MNEREFEYSVFFPDPKPIVQFAKYLAESHQLPIRIDLLDIGCGFGRTLLDFNKLGWKITAYEPDPDFYGQAKTLEDTLTQGSSVIQGGFLDIDSQNEFDMVVAINDPFAYLTVFSDRVEAISRMFYALRQGGVLMIDVPNFIYALVHPKPYEQRTFKIQERTYQRTTQQTLDFYENTYTNRDEYHMVDERGEACSAIKSQKLAILNFPELDYLLRSQGFVDVKTYSSYDARAPERLTGRRILISAQKPLGL